MWLAVISPHGKVTNTNEIVPEQSTANLASKANDKQQLSTAHAYNTRKQLEHNYAANGYLDDNDNKESYKPELLAKYGQSLSAWKDDMPIEDMLYMVKYMCQSNKHVHLLPKKS